MRGAAVGLAALVMSTVSCGGQECVPVPGPVRPAVQISVTAQHSAGPVTGAFVVVSRPGQSELGHSTQSCSPESAASVCRVQGGAGTYDLEVGAPGFTTQQLSVTVQGSVDECGYTDVTTQQLSVVLQLASDAWEQGARSRRTTRFS